MLLQLLRLPPLCCCHAVAAHDADGHPYHRCWGCYHSCDAAAATATTVPSLHLPPPPLPAAPTTTAGRAAGCATVTAPQLQRLPPLSHTPDSLMSDCHCIVIIDDACALWALPFALATNAGCPCGYC
jgi:hypothetical protein